MRWTYDDTIHILDCDGANSKWLKVPPFDSPVKSCIQDMQGEKSTLKEAMS